jgi:hypothetical protein
LLPRPRLGLLHEQSSDAGPAMPSVYHQAGDHDERFCLDEFCDRRVKPSNWLSITFGDKESVICSRKNSEQPRLDI